MNRPDPKYKLNDIVEHESLPGVRLTVISSAKWYDGGWHYIVTSIGNPVPEELLREVAA